MQMNIYVPKDKEPLLDALERASRQSGRAKNEMVLEALARYLVQEEPRAALPAYSLGEMRLGARDDLYLERRER